MSKRFISHSPMFRLLLAAAGTTCALSAAQAHAAPTLEGWALMPAQTSAVGPTSGQFAITPTSAPYLPVVNGQPVQGFSAVLDGPRPGTYDVMPDNGFGAQNNSADTLLRMYAVRPEWKRWNGYRISGEGSVKPAAFRGGRALDAFEQASFIKLRDPEHKLTFTLQADLDNYYGVATNPAVDAAIKAERLLTGADFDIESVRRDRRGNLWFGDEFGPFLVKTDKTGKVLKAEISLPNVPPPGSSAVGAFVQSPQNPFLAGATPNLGRSLGFEGMALNASRTKLYPLLEGSVVGDPAGSLRISEFDLDTEAYTGRTLLYKLDALGTNIGDMTAINDHEFLVIERNGNTATTAGAPYKRIFVVDLDRVDAAGFVQKTELVDLMSVADPHDLNADGSNVFTFPYVTIESVLVVNSRTLLVINDNNFPGGGGRAAAPDQTEFLLIGLDRSLPLRGGACPGNHDD
ncbi:MAG TPA: esterase-like activity of phytase family protein [Polyangiaceae bacterium]|nr:esterase-like activity of phytase family protein [Polyangiaceae bacterium]